MAHTQALSTHDLEQRAEEGLIGGSEASNRFQNFARQLEGRPSLETEALQQRQKNELIRTQIAGLKVNLFKVGLQHLNNMALQGQLDKDQIFTRALALGSTMVGVLGGFSKEAFAKAMSEKPERLSAAISLMSKSWEEMGFKSQNEFIQFYTRMIQGGPAAPFLAQVAAGKQERLKLDKAADLKRTEKSIARAFQTQEAQRQEKATEERQKSVARFKFGLGTGKRAAAEAKDVRVETNAIIGQAFKASRAEGAFGPGPVDIQRFLQFVNSFASSSSPEIRERVKGVADSIAETLKRTGGAKELSEQELIDTVEESTSASGKFDEDTFGEVIRRKREASRSLIGQAQEQLRVIQQSDLSLGEKRARVVRLIRALKQKLPANFPKFDIPIELRE